jgi:hypothetical protein
VHPWAAEETGATEAAEAAPRSVVVAAGDVEQEAGAGARDVRRREAHGTGGPRQGGGQDEEGYRQKVNERFDRLAERVERLEEEVRQLRGGANGGSSRGA